jgi:glutamate---cysteine ligase / carboxylate-amine ligase
MAASRPDRTAEPLGLFAGYGIELEYMIVDADSLDVHASADELLESVAGELTDEFENGAIAWNNELALHVIEFKCNGPQPRLAGLERDFQRNVALANEHLERRGRRLMPSAMHPWMDPATVRLWPHGTRPIYEAFDRIFSCRGHGWANLQSAHVNLPFATDEEFARLHAAIRFLIPVLPALSASSPVIDGERSGVADNRLAVYRGNCARIPSVTGEVVPEPVRSIDEYHERVLEPIYRALAPHDPDGILRHEWVNARGAIARFERMAIEIRVLDVQECPAADIARAAVIAGVLEALCESAWCEVTKLDGWSTMELAALLRVAEKDAERAEITQREYLAAFGFPGTSATLHRLWEHLIEHAAERGALDESAGRIAEHYLREGTLATRIVTALGRGSDRRALARVYGQLCDALASGTSFAAAGRADRQL